jgi:hypothetical protein
MLARKPRKRPMKTALFIIPVIIFAGCTSAERMSAYNAPVNVNAIEGSIFPSDLKSASNEDVVKVLEGKVPMMEKGNLAILPIGGMYFLNAGYSEQIRKQIQESLGGNKFVGDVVGVPRMLMPDKVSVTNIREMGARLQCENVLVFTAYNDSRYEFKVFSKDEVRANLTVEGVLVNVRSGCIPLAVTVDKEGVVKEQNADHDSYEFIRRAQRECLSDGIKDICGKINVVLSQVK